MQAVLIAVLATTLLGSGVVQAGDPAAANDRMTWFRDAKFGMFIHWGVLASRSATLTIRRDSPNPRSDAAI